MTETTNRQQTDIDRLAEAHLDAVLELSPMTATYMGVPGRTDEIDDLSIDGLRAHADLNARTLTALDGLEPVDDVDKVTVAAMHERLSLEIEGIERTVAGQDPTELNVIACPVQTVRDIFDIMPKETAQDWGVITARLRAVGPAFEQYAAALAHSAGHGCLSPRRQVERVAAQCADQAGDGSTYDALLTEAQGQSAQLREELATAVEEAKTAFGTLGSYLTDEILPQAPESDAAGVERYRLASRHFLGAEVDFAETYAWGLEEVARIDAMMQETAQAIRPGASVKEAIAVLDADPVYQLHGTDALRAWMQGKADEVIADLADHHFDIPEPLREIGCMIAPSQTGGVYYTGPSEDFARPGRMWWSVPKGVTEFTTWRELTTVYHEGVPGHHLQIAQTVYRAELLNRWRRMASWTSGHGEGWALYAEWLMADLGYMDDPGNRMGLLDGQALRATRVVLDIGIHCGLDAPDEVGGGAWTYDKAWEFLNNHTNMEEAFARFELDRYLGWPGQAPAYKIGERLWLQLRDQVREAEGDAFDLRAFHRRALDIGGVGLDTLRQAVLGEL
ncbi:DUF885 domain-containing protein [Ornithinimicrobium cryptoxanthini]|uniref:DUF885 domain-containing protein n=1 Tax=Ornithinimicrobium cryptoxanthini TaxID=2934161 RepID=UPI002118538F|nr:DUF885 domain-containing protein [Ornithinimicrobium cryptoxanthini]